MQKGTSPNTQFCEQKLIPTFHNRKNYILHLNCLIFYLSKGMILKKIHRIVSFKQAPFLKEYILTLTNLRASFAENNMTFFVNVFKLLANSTYGKFAQTPLNYTFAKICFNESQFKKNINSERFLRASIVNKDIAIVEFKPDHIVFDSAFCIAATILDLSKLYMYTYYYNVLKPTFHPDKIRMILHDTDSIIFEVNCENFFEKYEKMTNMEFSNFKKEHSLFSTRNRKALLYFKDENPNDYIKEFIGLRSKLYIIKTVSKENDIKAKGFNRHFKKAFLSFNKYKMCHRNLQIYRFPAISIRSFDHELFTVFQNKIVLNNFDSKMYTRKCNVHTFFYGSCNTNDKCLECEI